eukprot:TRINITY_DN15188_c0_g1_i1.p1 TRINITY_DN15188_c0_g1~~TRINITY_DN15188_c0_g1_i1.p1  ORF type:complete len:335 (-),score=58.49 TRINITY_DN15188_c0_g1_i1:72-1076(-)
MARYGAGDPRWLVQERTDGTNVNNWHWSDYNCSTVAKSRLSDSLSKLSIIENGEEFCRLVSVETIVGEVTVSVRKGKLLVFYEFDLKVKWEGCRGKGELQTGTVHIPNIETDDDDYEANISSKSKNTDSDYFIKAIKSKGLSLIQNQIEELVQEIKKEYQNKLLKEVPTNTKQTSTNCGVAFRETNGASGSSNSSSTDQTTASLSLNTFFSASAKEVYEALLDGPRNSAFTQSECQIDPKIGGKFSLFHGNIHGEFLELVPHQRIKKTWRMSTWATGTVSEVIIELKEEKNGVWLNLSQKGVPAQEKEKTESGWTENYWHGMKVMHNWGNMYGE